jgi:adenylate kinase family enzyme
MRLPITAEPVRRVLILGTGGAGKSTLAVRVGARLRLPVIHLDQHFWNAGWVPTPPDEWRNVVSELVARPCWVIDGNYAGTLDMRLPRADLVVFLDLPRRVAMTRVIRRWLGSRGRSRSDMAAGCPEHFDAEFLWWVWRFPRTSRPEVIALLRRYRAPQTTVRLAGQRQIDRWLEALSAA